jgi:hypothetical protein
MKRGVLLFAFNNERYDYYKMAVHTAKRVNQLLNLPVTIVTDESSISDNTYTFDNTILVTPNTTNKYKNASWINKDRYKAFQLTPYDETLLLDTDYLINSNKLLKLFELPTDFCCHDTTSFVMDPDVPQEFLSPYSFKTMWATVIKFNKTKKVEQIFDCIGMVQKNFQHYNNIYGFMFATYRNDFALTIARNIVHGHLPDKSTIIPWNLLHVGTNINVHRIDEFSYLMMKDHTQRGKTRKDYIIVKDTDFHMLNKNNFLELI